jgi:integrase
MENGRCKTNPSRLVKRLREDNERNRFLSEQEEKRIRAVIERDFPKHMPEFEIALHSGARREEQYRLSWSDVNCEGCRATLRNTKNRDTRHALLNSVARQALHDLLDLSDEEQGRVFSGARDKPLKKPRHWWDKVLNEAGIEVPSSWVTVRRSTPAITSLLAKVAQDALVSACIFCELGTYRLTRYKPI